MEEMGGLVRSSLMASSEQLKEIKAANFDIGNK